MADKSTRDLSDAHEKFWAELIGGRIMPGSGNQAANQTDVRTDPRDPWPLAIDGKSTRARSMIIRKVDWEKLVEQAHDCEPALGVRFYPNDRLTDPLDLVLVDAKYFATLHRLAAGDLDVDQRLPGGSLDPDATP